MEGIREHASLLSPLPPGRLSVDGASGPTCQSSSCHLPPPKPRSLATSPSSPVSRVPHETAAFLSEREPEADGPEVRRGTFPTHQVPRVPPPDLKGLLNMDLQPTTTSDLAADHCFKDVGRRYRQKGGIWPKVSTCSVAWDRARWTP